jgi:single-strand DNA-binding protein
MQSTVTLFGNLVDDVRLRETATTRVASFRIAMNDRWFDKRVERWAERTTYINVSAWRQLAENLAASLHKGQPVVVVGRLRQREFERDGQRITTYEVDADHVGHDLSKGSAVFARNPRGPQTSDVARVERAAATPSDPAAGTAWSVPGLDDPFAPVGPGSAEGEGSGHDREAPDRAVDPAA